MLTEAYISTIVALIRHTGKVGNNTNGIKTTDTEVDLKTEQ